MMITDNIVVQGRPDSKGGLRLSPTSRRKTYPFLASSDIVCSYPHMAMRLVDDEDGLSSERSSSNDSYVEAPLENAQVGGSDSPNLLRRLTVALGHTCAFSDGRSSDPDQGSSELLPCK